MEITSLPSGMFRVTLAATSAFNTSFTAFDRSFACGVGMDNTTIDLNCPITPDTHTCDFATHGAGGTYYFTYTCPYVEPTCLYWDEAAMDFAGDDCTLVSGYSSDAVTCDCSRTGTFVLGANATQPVFEAFATPAPTSLPTSKPTAQPTHVPTPLPSLTPTSSPTPRPSHIPTPLPSPLPTPSPTFTPTPQPTITYQPTTSPSFPPTPVPSPVPTLHPTTSDTASVSISFTCIATTGDPTDSDLAGLQSSLANATEVPNAEVKNLNVDTSANRRLSENTQGGGGRHLSAVNYTWVVTCDVEADLSDLGGISALEFESTVESNLNANSFERLLDLTVPSFTAMKEVTILLNTRRPTLQPTPYPSPLPTKDSKNKSNNPTVAILISLTIVAAVMMLVLIYKNYHHAKEHDKKNSPPALRTRDVEVQKPRKYVEPYLPRKSDSVLTSPPSGASVVSSPLVSPKPTPSTKPTPSIQYPDRAFAAMPKERVNKEKPVSEMELHTMMSVQQEASL
jgi:hypothetical protein